MKNAIERGDQAVVEYVRGYVYKAPSGGYKKLEDADSLDLACEALVADADKPYAFLFSDGDCEAARDRLAPHIKAIEARKPDRRARIDARGAELPTDLSALRGLADHAASSEDSIAINRAILKQAPEDVVAANRLGRAYEALGLLDVAADAFRQALAIDPRTRSRRGGCVMSSAG